MSAISVGSPVPPDGVRLGSCAVVQIAAVQASDRAKGSSTDPPRSNSLSGSHSRLTRMRFSVSVPVLSVQITVVDPRVSTAASRLTTAPRCASSRTPTASASVMVGSSPSGTLATSSPIEKLIAAVQPSPAASPAGRKAMANRTATIAMIQVALRTLSSNGLGSLVPRCDNAAMRPSSVCMPVWVTTVIASPPVQVVPLKISSRASRIEPVTMPASGDRVTGRDSPVKADRSTLTEPSMIRASAQTRSPSATTCTSPGTRSRAGIWVRTPFRMTVAVTGRNAASASTACSACISWAKAKPALSRITSTTATDRAGVPPTHARTAAIAKSTASG